MADPKYADLPGIAYDQADVYETTDLPESEQIPIDSKEENDSVELLNCNASDAFNKFKGKHIVSTGVDFSDRISLRSRTGYNVGHGEWESLSEGDKESPLQKFERLQFEIKELIEEINQLKTEAKSDKESQSTSDIITEVERAGRQLDGLRLQESLGTELMESLLDPQGLSLKRMMSQIELFKEIKNSNNADELTVARKNEGTLDSGVLRYQMMYHPEKARLQEMARIRQLEQRLGRLENIIGTSNDKLSTFLQSLKCQGVLEAIQQLRVRSSLLDSTQLDIVENRLATILNKMDNVVQKKMAVLQDSEKERKILEMYEIVKKVETVSHIFPQTVDRLMILNGIHQQAAEFSKSLGQLEELRNQITSGLEDNKFLLKGVQESFTSNLEIIKMNVASLDQRIQKLKT